MADQSVEKIILSLESLALSINRAVEHMAKIESKKEVSISSEQSKTSSEKAKTQEGVTERASAMPSIGKVGAGLAGLAGLSVGALGYVGHMATSGTPGIISNKMNDYFGTDVREKSMGILQNFLDAGVRPSDEDMNTIIQMEKRQSELKTETIERLQNKTQPALTREAVAFANQAMNLPKAFENEEGFRNQVLYNFGAVAGDTMSRLGDLFSGKLAFSDYIRGF